MTSVTVNGNTYSDDGSSAHDMQLGGFRANLLPMISDTMVDTAAKVTAAGAQATAAGTQAAAAAASAATALSAPGTNATSTTSLAVGTGSKSLTIQTGKSLVSGMSIVVSDTSTPTNAMYGNITSYNSGTGALVVNVTQVSGSGTIASWNVSLSGPLNAGVFNAQKGVDIASAATINLDTATGNLNHVTGTTTITAITLTSGRERTLVFDGILTLTNGASLICPGGANILTAAGDIAFVVGDGSAVRVASYIRATTLPGSGMSLLAALTPTAAAAVNALNFVSALYDSYLIFGEGINPATDASLVAQFAVAGSLAGGSAYANTTAFSATAASYGSPSISLNNGTQAAAGLGINFCIRIDNANSASALKSATSNVCYETTAGSVVSAQLGCGFNGGALSGIGFSFGGGINFKAQGSIRIYGIQKA